MTDKKMETVVGNMLRAGVIFAALIVLAGGVIYLLHHGHDVPEHKMFKGEPAEYRTLSGLFTVHTLESGRGLIMVGLIALILTPVARVGFSIVAFYLERDWTYVIVTTIVFGLLCYGCFS